MIIIQKPQRREVKISIWMTVPCDTRQQHLPALAAGCGLPADHIVVVRGATGPPAYIPGAHHLEQPAELNIHLWWNMGIDYARRHGASKVLVANDDVTFGPELIPAMSEAMDMADAVLAFPARLGGDPRLEASLWMLDLSSDVRPDERFRWWYGDNDLVYQAAGRVVTVPVVFIHYHPNELTLANPKLLELAFKDEVTFREKWGN